MEGKQRLCALCESKPPAANHGRGFLASDRVSYVGKLRKADFRLDRRAFCVNAGGELFPLSTSPPSRAGRVSAAPGTPPDGFPRGYGLAFEMRLGDRAT
jgi:hypothetical protein